MIQQEGFVEQRVIQNLKQIKDSQKLESLSDTYSFVISHWYLYDPFWLSIVRHLHELGRLQ